MEKLEDMYIYFRLPSLKAGIIYGCLTSGGINPLKKTNSPKPLY